MKKKDFITKEAYFGNILDDLQEEIVEGLKEKVKKNDEEGEFLRNYLTEKGWNKWWKWERLNSIEKMLFYKISESKTECDACEKVIEQYKLVSKDEWKGIEEVHGETMTSPWSIVKAYYETYKMDYQKTEDKGIYAWITSLKDDAQIDLATKYLLEFVDKAYSAGNFCRVPKEFNKARSGHYAMWDMWDLTLIQIFKWFKANSKGMKLVKYNNYLEYDNYDLHNLFRGNACPKTRCEAVRYTVEWLSKYDSLNDFVEKNYFEGYTSIEIETDFCGKKPMPITPWHSFIEVYPRNHMEWGNFLECLIRKIDARARSLYQDAQNFETKGILE